jgi:hypothetical protein
MADIVAAYSPDNGAFDAPFGFSRCRRKEEPDADCSDLE